MPINIKTISVYNIVKLLVKAYPKVSPPENTISGIRTIGVYPNNRDSFKDNEFLSSYVSDRMPTISSETFIDHLLSFCAQRKSCATSRLLL